jgi:hypothetical protein
MNELLSNCWSCSWFSIILFIIKLVWIIVWIILLFRFFLVICATVKGFVIVFPLWDVHHWQCATICRQGLTRNGDCQQFVVSHSAFPPHHCLQTNRSAVAKQKEMASCREFELDSAQ